MKKENFKYLYSPINQKLLDLEIIESKNEDILNARLIDSANDKIYNIHDGIVFITHPQNLNGLDKDFNEKYETNWHLYEDGMNWLFNSFYEKEEEVRKKLIKPLNLKSNSFVLNISCGAGGDTKYILENLGNQGKLFNLDLSANLLRLAKKKFSHSEASQEFIVANASYLPFPNDTFDSVFHFGGINVFSEKKKTIQEMVRVTKTNGRIVFGDESAAPWLRNKLFGKIIINANPLYKHQPPLNLLPTTATNVSLEYVLGNSFYLISFTKGEESSKLDLDLKIPGKRGGTLRTRYEINHLQTKK